MDRNSFWNQLGWKLSLVLLGFPAILESKYSKINAYGAISFSYLLKKNDNFLMLAMKYYAIQREVQLLTFN